MVTIDMEVQGRLLDALEGVLRSHEALQPVVTNSEGEIIDVLWAPLRKKTVALPDRINEPWVKIQRSWNQGYASEAHWLLSNGSQMSIREKIH